MRNKKVYYLLILTAIITFQLKVSSANRLHPLNQISACVHDKNTFRCVKYVKNYDADTITVNIPGIHPLLGQNISVRVLGIDSPEIKGRDKCEKEAALKAKRLVENVLSSAKNIDLKNIDRDKYFRILADVYVDGSSLRELLINSRLAVPYDGGTKSSVDWCK